MVVVYVGGSTDKLSENVNNMGDVRESDAKVNKTPNEVTIATKSERGSPLGTKLKMKFHGSLSNATISKAKVISKVLNILLLGEIIAIRCRGDLNPKKVAERTELKHHELLTETLLHKGSV